jgi:HK97 family phage major capsid protein
MSTPKVVAEINEKLVQIQDEQKTFREERGEYDKERKEFQESVTTLTTRMEEHSDKADKIEEQLRRSLHAKHGSDKAVPKDDWSWARFSLALARKDWDLAPYEASKIKEHREKMTKSLAMQGTDFGSGGALIPTLYVSELIELLRPELMTTALGVPTVNLSGGSPATWPKQTAGTSGTWIAREGSAITATKPSTGQLQLSPKKCAVLVRISNDLNLLSNPSVEALVRADMVAGLQNTIDVGFFQGLGANGEPIGMENQGITADGGTWDLSDTTAADMFANLILLKGLVQNVASNNALRGNLAFASNVDSWFAIDSIADANNRPYLQSEPAQSQIGGVLRGTITGYPMFGGVNVSATGAGNDNLWFGNWADAILAIWSSIEVAASTEADTAFATDELWIRAIARVDVGVRHTGSFTYLADVR